MGAGGDSLGWDKGWPYPILSSSLASGGGTAQQLRVKGSPRGRGGDQSEQHHLRKAGVDRKLTGGGGAGTLWPP